MKITEKELRGVIIENITKVLNEGRANNPVEKWVYWCMNYDDPKVFIEAMLGSKSHYLYEHYLSKFNAFYKQSGPDGVMNRFFLALDGEHRQKLLDYVEQR